MPPAATDRPDAARPAMAAAWDGLQGESIDRHHRRRENQRRHRPGRIHLRMAPAQGPDVDLHRRTADGSPRRRVGRAVDVVGHPPATRRHPDDGTALDGGAAGAGERGVGVGRARPGRRARGSASTRARPPMRWGQARRLADALRKFDPTITAQSIVESSTAAPGAYHVATLQQDDYERVQALLSVLPGVVVGDEADLVSHRPRFRTRPDRAGQEDRHRRGRRQGRLERRDGQLERRRHRRAHRDRAAAGAVVLRDIGPPDPGSPRSARSTLGPSRR